jgi:hypothetical protein
MPFDDTAATAVLLLFQLTALFVALAGVMAWTRVSEAPATAARLTEVLFNDTPVTAMGFTVTAQVAVLPPSAVVTVIVADPGATAVTMPFDDTVATALLLLTQLKALFVALEGVIVGTRVSAAPTKRLVDAFNETPVTKMGVTETAQVAILPPSVVVTVMVADPGVTAATMPFDDTVATAELLLLQLTALFVAFSGVMVEMRVSTAPTTRLTEVLFNDTPVTATVVGVVTPPPPLLPPDEGIPGADTFPPSRVLISPIIPSPYSIIPFIKPSGSFVTILLPILNKPEIILILYLTTGLEKKSFTPLIRLPILNLA